MISFSERIMFMRFEEIAIKVDSDLVKEAETLFAKLGITLQEAIIIFLEHSVREQSIPFEVTRKISL